MKDAGVALIIFSLLMIDLMYSIALIYTMYGVLLLAVVCGRLQDVSS
jgi:hypothetical protein